MIHSALIQLCELPTRPRQPCRLSQRPRGLLESSPQCPTPLRALLTSRSPPGAGSAGPTSCSSPRGRLTSVKRADFSFQPSSLKPPEGSLKRNHSRAAHKKYFVSEHPKLLAQVRHIRLNAAHHTLPAFRCSELSVNSSGKAPTWLQSSSRDL